MLTLYWACFQFQELPSLRAGSALSLARERRREKQSSGKEPCEEALSRLTASPHHFNVSLFALKYCSVEGGNFPQRFNHSQFIAFSFRPYFMPNWPNHSDLDSTGKIFSSCRNWCQLWSEVMTSDRSGTKAKSCQGLVLSAQATRGLIQICIIVHSKRESLISYPTLQMVCMPKLQLLGTLKAEGYHDCKRIHCLILFVRKDCPVPSV